MKNYLKISLFIVLPSLLMAQSGLVNNGATIKVMTNAQLKVKNGGILSHDNGKILNAGHIYVEQDWVQKGDDTYLGNGALIFSGSKSQKLSSNTHMNIATLTVDNGHSLILDNTIYVWDAVDLAHNGRLQLNDYDLILEPKAKILNFDPQHYIITNGIGCLQQFVTAQPTLFPIGNSRYNPAKLKNTGTPDNFRIKVHQQLPLMHNSHLVNQAWWIEEETLGGSLVQLSLQWDPSQELNQFDRRFSAITPVNNVKQTNLPDENHQLALATGSYWTQSITKLTSFSSFVVSSRQAAALTIHPTMAMNNSAIHLFPNPVEHFLNIRFEQPIQEAFIQIMDNKGSLILQTTKRVDEGAIVQLDNLQDLVDGVYWIRIFDGAQPIYADKFVKKRP